jgi:hypothetical protein
MPDASLNFNQIKELVSSTESIRSNPFGLAGDIAAFVSSDEEEEKRQEIVLRALDNKEAFGTSGIILEAAVRRVGLYPYLESEELSVSDQIAIELHRVPGIDDDIIFHRPQAEVFRALLTGKNVILSAPTSFGKSLIIDAAVASEKFKNILIVVPTIALIDETRRRLTKRFRDRYKIITHASQPRTDRNIFVLTQERVYENNLFEGIDFFVVDEFYKLNPANTDDARWKRLNHVVYRLVKSGAQFYMLGPNVLGISEGFAKRLRYETFIENFKTVASDIHQIPEGGNEWEKLLSLCSDLTEPTIIFCKSPNRAVQVVEKLIETSLGVPSSETQEAARWIADHYHKDWHFTRALFNGIGVHHGRIPRALAQYVVRAFNDGLLKFLVCTSTLIEGVNSKAKNIIIFDNKINSALIDFFTFNNIKGRSGRMGHYFIGNVYLFHPPPQDDLPFIDAPIFSQSEEADPELLLQVDSEDLTDESKRKLSPFIGQTILDYATLCGNAGIDPDKQIIFARELTQNWPAYEATLVWSNLPTSNQVFGICNLIWKYFDGGACARGSVLTYRQLAFLINQLRGKPRIKEQIINALQYSNGDIDTTVQRILDFQRLWANFHFPRILMAIDAIQKDVARRLKKPSGDYSFFAKQVENMFLDPSIVSLDEYGVPIELGRKLERYLASDGNLDIALDKLKRLPIQELGLEPFERLLLADAIENA